MPSVFPFLSHNITLCNFATGGMVESMSLDSFEQKFTLLAFLTTEN